MYRCTFEYDDYPEYRTEFLAFIDGMKERFPDFKCSVFAYPLKMRKRDWRDLKDKRGEWVQVCPHGLHHQYRETRVRDIWSKRLHILDDIVKDDRWTLLFKSHRNSYETDFCWELHHRGFAWCINALMNCEYPMPDGWRLYCRDDQAHAAQSVGLECTHVVGHPPHRLPWHTWITKEGNLKKWHQAWESAGGQFRFVTDFVRPASLRINLGCGDQIWDGWLCLDPRADKLGHPVRQWSFDKLIPCKSNMADVVFSSHVFEFLEESQYVPAMLDIWRALRPHAVWRLSEIECSDDFYWRKIGAKTRIGRVRSHPTRQSIRAAAERVGFEWHDAVPCETISPCKDVLQGDSRHHRYRKGHKFYAECIKRINIDNLSRDKYRDPRSIPRQVRYVLPEENPYLIANGLHVEYVDPWTPRILREDETIVRG